MRAFLLFPWVNMYCVRLIFLGLILTFISAAPFNFQEERKKVFEEVIHYKEPSARESRLIDKVVEARKLWKEERQEYRQEAYNQASRANVAEAKIETLTEFIRRLYCPTEMRYSIEIFSLYLEQPSNAMIRMGTLQKELSDLFNQILKNLTAGVQSISSETTKFTDVEPDEKSLEDRWLNSKKSELFDKYWSKLKDTLSSTLTYTQVCQSVQQKQKSLTDLLFELVCAKNIKEAQKLYLSNMSLWIWPKLDVEDKHKILKSISYDEILLRTEHYSYCLTIIKNGKEKYFSNVFLNIERYFQEGGGKIRDAHYKECMCVLYFSQHYAIEKLWNSMEQSDYILINHII